MPIAPERSIAFNSVQLAWATLLGRRTSGADPTKETSQAAFPAAMNSHIEPELIDWQNTGFIGPFEVGRRRVATVVVRFATTVLPFASSHGGSCKATYVYMLH